MLTKDPITLLNNYGVALLEEYISLETTTAEDEREYLIAFQKQISAVKKLEGIKSPDPIIPKDDYISFLCLPRILRIYRGYHEPEKRNGISWSLSRKVAEGFAYGRRRETIPPPMVVTGTCRRTMIVAYSNSGNEQEIIIDPRDVRSIHNIKVREKPLFPVVAESPELILGVRQHHGSEIISPA